MPKSKYLISENDKKVLLQILDEANNILDKYDYPAGDSSSRITTMERAKNFTRKAREWCGYLKIQDETTCDGCIHRDGCRYFDLENSNLSTEERFNNNCIGCCCGDGLYCNFTRNKRCTNYEDGSGPLLG